MGTLGNLFELVRDTSYQQIEEETNRQFVSALSMTRDHWGWKEYRSIKRMSDEALMRAITELLS